MLLARRWPGVTKQQRQERLALAAQLPTRHKTTAQPPLPAYNCYGATSHACCSVDVWAGM